MSGRCWEVASGWRLGVASGLCPVDQQFTPEPYVTPIDGDRYVLLGSVPSREEGTSRGDGALRAMLTQQSVAAGAIGAEMVELALHRFATEAPGHDVLQNELGLPDGRRQLGNRLVRGQAAESIAAELNRGDLPEEPGVAGEQLYLVTATSSARARMRAFARRMLADTGATSLRTWCEAAYLLFQAPRYEAGSAETDSVMLVALSAVLFDVPLMLVDDVALRAAVMDQGGFVEHLQAAQDLGY